LWTCGWWVGGVKLVGEMASEGRSSTLYRGGGEGGGEGRAHEVWASGWGRDGTIVPVGVISVRLVDGCTWGSAPMQQ
jgi:hypothetical protein